jgi:chorismate mutase/prephenate dehydratase
VVNALEELKGVAAFYKNLGSYPHSAWFSLNWYIH